MDDQEALLQLYAGDPDERSAALEAIFDRYYAKVVEALISIFRFDQQSAEVGAAEALLELHRDAADVVPRIEKGSEQPYRWLLGRAHDRAVDEARRTRRMLKNVPKNLKRTFQRHELPSDDSDAPLAADGSNPAEHAAQEDSMARYREAALRFLEDIEGDERGIFLHDLVFRYELLSEQEAAEFDEELIGRSHPDGIHTDEALEKRRQRLIKKLRAFFES